MTNREIMRQKLLAELPPDERERILADLAGPDALAFAVTVEVRLQVADWEQRVKDNPPKRVI